MTVRIGTGSSAVDPSALRVAGVSPSKIMLGTGSAAVEVWSASIYPLTGSWSGSSGFATATKDTHTIAEAGTFTITHSILVTNGYGISARIKGPWGTTSGSGVGPWVTSTATTTRTLSVGTLIEFQVQGSSNPVSGTWSITKN